MAATGRTKAQLALPLVIRSSSTCAIDARLIHETDHDPDVDSVDVLTRKVARDAHMLLRSLVEVQAT